MISRFIIVLWTGYCVYGVITGAANVDAVLLNTSTAYQAGVGLGIIGWFVVWAIVIVPVSLIALVFRHPEKAGGKNKAGDIFTKIFPSDF